MAQILRCVINIPSGDTPDCIKFVSKIVESGGEYRAAEDLSNDVLEGELLRLDG